MANAKKLTEAQITAIRFIAQGTNPFALFGRRKPNCGTKSVHDALARRGLITGGIHDPIVTPAGRAALFGATGAYGYACHHEAIMDGCPTCAARKSKSRGPEHISNPLARAIDKIKGDKP